MKTKVVIVREGRDKYTKGTLQVFQGIRIVLSIKTLELPYIDNNTNISCIPSGIYQAKKDFSPSRGVCFRVMDVPGRTGILIHAGNFAAGERVDTQGCILPGISFKDINNDGYEDITDSRAAMDMMLAVLPEQFQLNIL